MGCDNTCGATGDCRIACNTKIDPTQTELFIERAQAILHRLDKVTTTLYEKNVEFFGHVTLPENGECKPCELSAGESPTPPVMYRMDYVLDGMELLVNRLEQHASQILKI